MSDNPITAKNRVLQRLILESHLWLGLGAVFCTWGTFVLLHQSVSFRYLAFVLVGTMTIYSYHGYRNRKESGNSADTHPQHPAFLKLILAAGCLATLVLYLMLKRTNQLILLIPACMALVYVLPVYRGKKLKDLPYIKIVAIVVAWTIITYLIPLRTIPEWWTEKGYNLLMLDRLLFFFALAIPFDIRDMNYDRDQKLPTIPNTIGLDNSRNLALFSIFMAGGFMTMAFELLEIEQTIRIGLILLYILIGIVIIRLKNNPGPRFYSWVIDGFLFLYGIVILILFD